jgi:hypothetical protein
MCNKSISQVKWKEYIVPGSAMLVSGMIDGTIESIKFHYDTGFKPHFKNIDDQIWNPDLSWKNKYKGGDPNLGPRFFGSTTAFVFTTDAYHALRTSKNLVNTGVVVFYLNRAKCSPRKFNWKKILVDALVLTAARNIGFHVTYSLAFPKHKSF